MFKVGDIIVGNERSDKEYGATNSNCLMQITEIKSTGLLKIRIIGYAEQCVIGYEVNVRADLMELADIPSFVAKHPEFYYDNDIVSSDLTEIKPVFPMNTTYIPTEEEIDRLVEGFKRLNKYGYTMTDTGIKYILREFFKNKGWIIDLMKNHPNYVDGKYQIVFNESYPRELNYDGCHEFGNWIRNRRREVLKEAEMPEGAPSYEEIRKQLRDLDYYISRMMELNNKSEMKVNLGGYDIEHFIDEKTKYLGYKDLYSDATKYTIMDGVAYTPESVMAMNKLSELSRILRTYSGESTINECVAEDLNDNCDASSVAGQKLSRAVNKILIACGMDTLQDVYFGDTLTMKGKEKAFAAFADAVSPGVFTRPTIISCNPIDFLTMSFGNSWQSCMTIDKQNMRGIDGEHTYRGTKSGGTLSYMMDSATLMLYTVSSSYTGNEWEFEDKITRNLFHIGHDKVIQGRVYPQTTDGAENVYSKLRGVFQKKLKECLRLDNAITWSVSSGVTACDRNTVSCGVHYRDYITFDNCNVSYMIVDGVKHKLVNKIVIGHDSICPCCGREHSNDENIMCGACEDNELYCGSCGQLIEDDDMREYMVIRPSSYGQTTCYCEECAQINGYENENPFRGIAIPASELTEEVA